MPPTPPTVMSRGVPAHSLQFHFIFFTLLITVVYFKAQAVKPDLETLVNEKEASALKEMRSVGASGRPASGGRLQEEGMMAEEAS